MERRPLTDEELAEIREREQRASRGPWREHLGEIVGPDGIVIGIEYDPFDDEDRLDISGEDREFIIHTRTDVPALLATVDYWRERAERAEAIVQRVREFVRALGERQSEPPTQGSRKEAPAVGLADQNDEKKAAEVVITMPDLLRLIDNALDETFWAHPWGADHRRAIIQFRDEARRRIRNALGAKAEAPVGKGHGSSPGPEEGVREV